MAMFPTVTIIKPKFGQSNTSGGGPSAQFASVRGDGSKKVLDSGKEG